MPEPSYDLIKDMYATFGHAYAISENLCQGLGIFYAFMGFRDADDATRPRLEEKMVEVAALTLGQVIGKVKPLVSADLQNRLDRALEKRNYLAHEFWYERVVDMFKESGVIKLIEELQEIGQLFDELDQELEMLVMQRCEALGITNELLEEHLHRIQSGEADPPFPAKLPLTKRNVRIIRAYDITVDNRIITQIFETEDAQFLQFCDVGLGWSNFAEVQENWMINEKIQKYLPANISPRPDVVEPWNYEFKLPRHAVLWIEKGSKVKTYRWGIRTE